MNGIAGALGSVGFALAFAASAAAQPRFVGTSSAVFDNANVSTLSGLGTSAVTFAGDPAGGVAFTGTAFDAPEREPFLLGTVRFSAGGARPDSLDFVCSLGLAGRANMPACTMSFSFPFPLSLTEFREGSDRTMTLQFPLNRPVAFQSADGHAYALELVGLTQAGVAVPADGLTAATGGDPQAADVWADAYRVNPTGPNDLGCLQPAAGVPEPAGVITAIIGLVLVRRRVARRATRVERSA